MQRAYIGKLMELAEKDKRIVQVLADSGTNLDELFRKNFPDQIINLGIAEQNAIGVASGMAMSGEIPFVFIQGAFIVYRAMEFVRNDVCFHNANVKLIGQGSGVSWCGLGPSHHTTEDMAVLAGIPNLKIFSPATPFQVRELIEKLYKEEGPCYLRLGMNNEKEFFEKDYSLPAEGYDLLKQGKDMCIISTGSILEEVMGTATKLEEIGINPSVINVYRIKPFDKIILEKIKKFDKIYVVEEHQRHGGLGSIISDLLTDNGLGIKVIKLCYEDSFAKGYSSSLSRLRKENRMDSTSLFERIINEYD